ncbi:MAG: F0F1 ATP synthase subunit delta [Desulfurivibrionaceae bacterium]
MKNEILARRYAKAMFVVGSEEDTLDEFAQGLETFAELYRTLPEMRDALSNPIYPMDVRQQVMEKMAAKIGVGKTMTRFLDLLVEKGRATLIPEIAESYQAMVDEERGVCQGLITTASELSSDLQEKTKTTLEKLTGRQVVLKTEIDPSIIGGIVAKVGDLVVDGSIKTQIDGLKDTIKGSE